MAINLFHEPEQTIYARINQSKFTDWGLVIAIVILAISLSIFGGLKYVNQKDEIRKADLEKEIEIITKSLAGEDVDELADFMQRLSIVDIDTASRVSPNDFIQAIGKSMVVGSYVKGVEAKADKAVITYVTDNYLVAAKQILSLRKSSHFSEGIRLKNISRAETEKGKVLIDVEVSI